MSETGEIEATVEYVKRTIFTKRKEIFWFLFFLALCWLILQIKEIATILFLSYFISLLLDPILTKLQNRRVPRALSLIILAIIFLVFITTFMAVAIPAILDEYSSLVELFPNYLRELTEKINILSVKLFNRSTPFSPEDIWLRIREYSEHMGIEPIKNALSSLFNTMLSGYSLTLTFLNFILLPLFVFYISMDLKKIHIFIGRFLPVEWRQNTAQIGKEILSHIYVFLKGQLTICLILAVL